MDIPGFADLQVNGHEGVDFSSEELTPEAFISASKKLIARGTAIFLPTVITSSEQLYRRNLTLIAECMEHEELKPHMPGFHLEGPFLSSEEGAIGAHNPDWVQKPDPDFLDQLIEWTGNRIKMLTIAAEIEGAAELCEYAVDKGITVSLGHQLPDEQDLDRLARAGARSLTHLGNGLPRMLPRHHNPLWAGIAEDRLIAMVIADGHHLPDSILKTIFRTKTLARTVVVSDASPIAGLPPGRYRTLGNDVILEEGGRLYNPETGYLVGSSSTMLDCMNYLLSLDLFHQEELFDIGFHNPLKLIDVDPKTVARKLPSLLEFNGEFRPTAS